jgi:TonB family protein
MTVFEEIVRSLFWFHPAVRRLITEIQLVREQVVDRQSVEMTGSRETYLDALLEVARSRMHPAIALAPSFLGKRQIQKRVEILLKEVSMSKFRLTFSFAIMLALVAGAQWFSASSFPLQSSAPLAAQPKVPAPEGPVYSVQQDGVAAPRVLHKLEPSYTDEARDAQLEGMCVLEIEIWPDGRAHEIEVVQPLGLGLDEAATEAIEQWVFDPGLKDGVPVAVRATVEVNFRLR